MRKRINKCKLVNGNISFVQNKIHVVLGFLSLILTGLCYVGFSAEM